VSSDAADGERTGCYSGGGIWDDSTREAEEMKCAGDRSPGGRDGCLLKEHVRPCVILRASGAGGLDANVAACCVPRYLHRIRGSVWREIQLRPSHIILPRLLGTKYCTHVLPFPMEYLAQ
jgi:hypothetical protein